MYDLRDYLRAYWAYFSTSGWRKPVLLGLIWLAGMFTLVGDIFAPYGMWKAQRKK